MKKRVVVVLLAIALFISIVYVTYCRRCVSVYDADSSIMMRVIDISYDRVVVRISNYSSYAIAVWHRFYVEHCYSGSWEQLQGIMAGDILPLGGIQVEAGAYLDFTRYFSHDYLPLESGVYRIIKRITQFEIDGYEYNRVGDHYLFAEFIVIN